MIKKIIYFTESPLTLRDYDRFGIDTIIKNGFDVEFWDLTEELCPELNKTIKDEDRIRFNGNVILKEGELVKKITVIEKECLIICMLHYGIKTHFIFRELSRNKLKYCLFFANALPVFSRKCTFKLSNIITIIKYCCQMVISYVKNIYIHIKQKMSGIKPASIILAGGEKSIDICRSDPYDSNSKVLWMHTLDYDLYLKENCHKEKNDEKLVVFNDEYFPFHPDYLYSGIPAPVTAEEYYPALCKLFNFIETKYNKNIVIAAHPRSNYERHPDYFEGRSVIKGKTIELVRKSSAVLLSCSTSVNFAVLYNKPIIFITTKKLNNTWWGMIIELMAACFNKKPVCIDMEYNLNWENEMTVRKEMYNKYKNDYIKKNGTEELPFWQIFANYIKMTKIV